MPTRHSAKLDLLLESGVALWGPLLGIAGVATGNTLTAEETSLALGAMLLLVLERAVVEELMSVVTELKLLVFEVFVVEGLVAEGSVVVEGLSFEELSVVEGLNFDG